MLKPLLFSLALFAAASAPAGSVPRPQAGHPILGVWLLKVPNTDCTEIYSFRRNGTTLVASNEEEVESEFEISPQPSDRGFYKWTDKIVKDNGGEDCVGDTAEIGRQVINFIRFSPAGDMFVICQDETMRTCIGPLKRIREEDIDPQYMRISGRAILSLPAQAMAI